MKIAVTGPAKRYEAELEDQKGEELFQKIVGLITEEAARSPAPLRPGGKARSMGRPARIQKPQTEATDPEDPGSEEEPDQGKGEEGQTKGPAERKVGGAWGFLVIRCPSCGTVRAFHSREEIDKYRCRNCKARTLIKPPLREVFTLCGCGKGATYKTNITEGRIDVPCVACGELIPCEYNPKRDAFFYIRGGQKAAREAAKATNTGDPGSDPDLIKAGQNGQK